MEVGFMKKTERKTLADFTRTIEPAPQAAKTGFKPETATVRELIAAGAPITYESDDLGPKIRLPDGRIHLLCLR